MILETDYHPYSTHQPLLVAAVAITRGPVLEFGVGWSSTPILQALCGAQNRRLTSFESDPAWLDKMRHDGAVLMTSWDELPKRDLHCSVALVDNNPAEARVTCIEAVRHHAQIVIVHDTESSNPGVEDALQRFRYRIDDKRQLPWTSAVSDTIDVEQLLRRAIG